MLANMSSRKNLKNSFLKIIIVTLICLWCLYVFLFQYFFTPILFESGSVINSSICFMWVIFCADLWHVMIVDVFWQMGDESETRSGRETITQASGGGRGACPMPIRHFGCIIHTDSLRSSLKGVSHSARRQVRFDGFWVSGNTVITHWASGNSAQWALTLQVPGAGLCVSKQTSEPWLFWLISCCTVRE